MNRTPTQEKELLIAQLDRVRRDMENAKTNDKLLSAQLGQVILRAASKNRKRLEDIAKQCDLPTPRIINWLYGNAAMPTQEARKLWKAATA